MGQSAGAHIAACALIEQAIEESQGHSISWSVSQIKAYFGLSGGYVYFAATNSLVYIWFLKLKLSSCVREPKFLEWSQHEFFTRSYNLIKSRILEQGKIISVDNNWTASRRRIILFFSRAWTFEPANWIWWSIECGVYRYNLFSLVDHFHNRGLYRSIFLRYL